MDEQNLHDLEVTSLRSGAREPWGAAAHSSMRTGPGTMGGRSRPGGRSRGGPLPPGQRRLVTSLLATAGVLVALVVVLITSQPDLRASLGALVHPPTPTFAPLAFGANFFFVEHEVPWGVLRVDGKQQDVLDVSQYGSNAEGATSFGLDRGRHSVEYTAAPFATLRCRVSVPADRQDTCPIARLDPNSKVSALGAARVLDLQATPDHLPADKLTALTDAVTHLISITTAPVPVPAGEQYLTGNGIVTAAQTLQATLFREPWNAPSGVSGLDCTFLCLLPPQNTATPGTWQLIALVRQGFTYATSAGQIVVADAPLTDFFGNGGGALTLTQDELSLVVRWAGSWQVALASPDNPPPTCIAGRAELSNAKGYGADGPGAPQYNLLKPIAAADPADGCVVGLQQVDPSTGKAMGQPIYLLYRFGLLLATDDAGHQQFPGLPYATPRERTITQQIIAQGH